MQLAIQQKVLLQNAILRSLESNDTFSSLCVATYNNKRLRKYHRNFETTLNATRGFLHKPSKIGNKHIYILELATYLGDFCISKLAHSLLEL
jgi:hypothetical protein